MQVHSSHVCDASLAALDAAREFAACASKAAEKTEEAAAAFRRAAAAALAWVDAMIAAAPPPPPAWETFCETAAQAVAQSAQEQKAGSTPAKLAQPDPRTELVLLLEQLWGKECSDQDVRYTAAQHKEGCQAVVTLSEHFGGLSWSGAYHASEDEALKSAAQTAIDNAAAQVEAVTAARSSSALRGQPAAQLARRQDRREAAETAAASERHSSLSQSPVAEQAPQDGERAAQVAVAWFRSGRQQPRLPPHANTGIAEPYFVTSSGHHGYKVLMVDQGRVRPFAEAIGWAIDRLGAKSIPNAQEYSTLSVDNQNRTLLTFDLAENAQRAMPALAGDFMGGRCVPRFWLPSDYDAWTEDVRFRDVPRL